MNKFIILIPVFNDWKSVSKLINELNRNLFDKKGEVSIIIVDDASKDPPPQFDLNIENIKSFKIIHLKKNGGSTRAILSGLKYIFKNEDFDYVIPMDGDGEDRPEEVKNFINLTILNPHKTIVGERIKRSENFIFKLCYEIHKIITLVFTGRLIKFGNFTCIPKIIVEKMINEKASWSSFSGALTKIEKNKIKSPSIRGKRYFDLSKVGFYNLIKHSFSIIAVFKSTVIIRSILFYAIYLMIISKHISYVTSIPLVLIIIFAISIFNVSKRENLEELNKSLENINDINNIK